MRPINADALITAMNTWDWQELYLPIHFKQLIDEQPTADVVEVVKCKYCKWHGYLTCSNPEGLKGWVTDECFCSFAERRNDECY